MRKKNLEAENEIFKGIFRSPFSFLIGGPCGFVANAIYTIIRTHDEIKQNEQHKEFINSQFCPMVDIKEIEENKIIENAKLNEARKQIATWLYNEFGAAEEICLDKSYYYFRFLSKDKLFHGNKQKSCIRFGVTSKDYVGYCYHIEDFIKYYKKDLKENNITKKYYCSDGCVKFLYITKSNELVCTNSCIKK